MDVARLGATSIVLQAYGPPRVSGWSTCGRATRVGVDLSGGAAIDAGCRGLAGAVNHLLSRHSAGGAERDHSMEVARLTVRNR